MSLYGIFGSPWQRRKFFLSSVSVVLVTALVILVISLGSPETRGWNLVLDVLVGLLVSATFVIIASIYIKYFSLTLTKFLLRLNCFPKISTKH